MSKTEVKLIITGKGDSIDVECTNISGIGTLSLLNEVLNKLAKENREELRKELLELCPDVEFNGTCDECGEFSDIGQIIKLLTD